MSNRFSAQPATQFTGLSARFAIVGLCLITAGFALTGAIQYLRPLAMPAILPFAETFHSQALAADSETAIALADQAIEAAPARGELEVLKARLLIEQSRSLTPALTPATIEALRTSYLKSPLSPKAHKTRLSLIYGYWPHMPLDLRRLANAEARTYAQRYSGRIFLNELRPTLSPPAATALDLSLSQAGIGQN
ncbi:hypothetical protein [Asticcacaulis tiandongensis]|uniref:hypothetical protein n=1 Tax=Asticcacaulis tiandongensis TaxID=2565365 RepID=UPI001129F09A|nr:hypothetical protein [Asticcacaulis tiandongensis]